MKIKFKVEKKDFKILRKIFEDYVKSRYHPTSSPELYTGDFGANGRITRDCITINLCTGNTWRCYINNIPNAFEINGYFVEYNGSRAGLHALTPFAFSKKFIDSWVDEDSLNITIKNKQETKTLTLTIVGFKTSNGLLKWSERLELLAEEKGKAVVMSWNNIPLRVVDYKNVYKKGE